MKQRCITWGETLSSSAMADRRSNNDCLYARLPEDLVSEIIEESMHLRHTDKPDERSAFVRTTVDEVA